MIALVLFLGMAALTGLSSQGQQIEENKNQHIIKHQQEIIDLYEKKGR